MKFEIKHIKQTISTNTLLIEEAKKGAAEGLVIWADDQTAGRGQFDRKWISVAGKDLLFSFLLRPPVAVNQSPILTQIICRSVAKFLETNFALKPTLKKPNDVLVGGRKICGILTEACSGSSGKLDFVVVGIGLNMNSSQTELIPEATSVTIETGQTADLASALDLLLGQIKKDIATIYAHTS